MAGIRYIQMQVEFDTMAKLIIYSASERREAFFFYSPLSEIIEHVLKVDRFVWFLKPLMFSKDCHMQACRQ